MADVTKTLLILGRQPTLGVAELERLYGDRILSIIGSDAAVLNLDPDTVEFARLGGSVKLCKVITSFESVNWPKLLDFVEKLLPTILPDKTDGKIRLGISCFGFSSLAPKQLFAAGLGYKKTLRQNGFSVRLVPNQTTALNSAQVLHNRLTKTGGIELVLVRNGSSVVIAQTLSEQDIEAYTVRDRGRPMRDTRVGMLPPKLAQIIINLAMGNKKTGQATILDPFCGTGVLLQEAAVMGCGIYGTDIDQRMISYSRQNLDWLEINNQNLSIENTLLETGDATTLVWDNPFDVVASETYLGQAFNTLPSKVKIDENIHTCNVIMEKFLANIAKQIEPGTSLCLAIPAWQHKPGQFLHLPLLDHLEKLGYNRMRFSYVRNEELVYFRDEQIVARELLVITRK